MTRRSERSKQKRRTRSPSVLLLLEIVQNSAVGFQTRTENFVFGNYKKNFNDKKWEKHIHTDCVSDADRLVNLNSNVFSKAEIRNELVARA